MINRTLCITLTLSLFLPIVSFAQQISDDMFRSISKLSGMEKQVGELTGVIWAGFMQGAQQHPPMSPTVQTKYKKAVDIAFNSSEMLKIVKTHVQNQVTENEANELIIWYKSKAGMEMAKAEEDASTPEAIQQMFKEARVIFADQKLVKIAIRIDSLIKGTEMTLALQKYSKIAMFTAFSTLKNPDTPVDMATFNTQMYAQEDQLRAQARQITILSLASCYKNTDPASMKKYIEFLKSPASRRFTASVSRGNKEAFKLSIDKMAVSLAAIARKDIELRKAQKETNQTNVGSQ